MLQGSDLAHQLNHITLQPFYCNTGLVVSFVCIFSFLARLITSICSSFHSLIPLPARIDAEDSVGSFGLMGFWESSWNTKCRRIQCDTEHVTAYTVIGTSVV